MEISITLEFGGWYLYIRILCNKLAITYVCVYSVLYLAFSKACLRDEPPCLGLSVFLHVVYGSMYV